jgi:hypothetical protein
MTWPCLGRQPDWCPPRRRARHQVMTIVRSRPWYERRPTTPDRTRAPHTAGQAERRPRAGAHGRERFRARWRLYGVERVEPAAQRGTSATSDPSISHLSGGPGCHQVHAQRRTLAFGCDRSIGSSSSPSRCSPSACSSPRRLRPRRSRSISARHATTRAASSRCPASGRCRQERRSPMRGRVPTRSLPRSTPREGRRPETATSQACSRPRPRRDDASSTLAPGRYAGCISTWPSRSTPPASGTGTGR